MMKKTVQNAVPALLVALCLAPSANADDHAPISDPQQVAEALIRQIENCLNLNVCDDLNPLEDLERCLQADLGLCYVCYDFHGSGADMVGGTQVIQESITKFRPGSWNGNGARIVMPGYGVGENGDLFGYHVVEYDRNGWAMCE